MDGEAREFVEGLQQHFAELKDPRITAACDHDVLAMKGNQPGLEEDLQQPYMDASDNDFAGLKHEECETTEKAHGRSTT